MTAPRRILERVSYLITRRCFQRELLLTPSATVSEVFAYVLALAAKRHGVLVHAFCVMSNHYHLVVTDERASLPRFQQLLDALVARAINALHGRWETFWAPSSYSAVVLASRADILDKAAYVLANPVAAGLVPAARAWPGAWSDPLMAGVPVEVHRPDHFFSKRGRVPARVQFELHPPPGFGDAAEYRAELEAALTAREASANAERSAFLGVAKVLAQDPRSRPRAPEPRRGLRPRVAALDRWRRLELLGRLKGFLAEYREALVAWRDKRPCRFPAGTYLMRVAHGAPCSAVT